MFFDETLCSIISLRAKVNTGGSVCYIANDLDELPKFDTDLDVDHLYGSKKSVDRFITFEKLSEKLRDKFKDYVNQMNEFRKHKIMWYDDYAIVHIESANPNFRQLSPRFSGFLGDFGTFSLKICQFEN